MLEKLNKYCFAAIVCLIFAGNHEVAARHISKTELAQKAAMAAHLLSQADEKMKAQMQSGLAWLTEFYRFNGHYPQSSQEIVFSQNQMSNLLGASPYELPPAAGQSEEPYLAQFVNLLDQKPDEQQRVKLVLDPGLSAGKLELARLCPPDDWFAGAGRLVVISNGQDLCAVAASGSDGAFLRDAGNGQVIFYLSDRAVVHVQR